MLIIAVSEFIRRRRIPRSHFSRNLLLGGCEISALIRKQAANRRSPGAETLQSVDEAGRLHCPQDFEMHGPCRHTSEQRDIYFMKCTPDDFTFDRAEAIHAGILERPTDQSSFRRKWRHLL